MSVSLRPGHGEPVDDEAEDDRAGGRDQERADDPAPEVVGHPDREVPDGDPHHDPDEHAHRRPCFFLRARLPLPRGLSSVAWRWAWRASGSRCGGAVAGLERRRRLGSGPPLGRAASSASGSGSGAGWPPRSRSCWTSTSSRDGAGGARRRRPPSPARRAAARRPAAPPPAVRARGSRWLGGRGGRLRVRVGHRAVGVRRDDAAVRLQRRLACAGGRSPRAPSSASAPAWR